MTPSDAFAATFALICAAGLLYLIGCVIRAAWPPRRNRYVRRAPDARCARQPDWRTVAQRGRYG